MTRLAETAELFPVTDLNSSETEIVYSFCGGDDPELGKMRYFLQNSGLNAIPRGWYREYLQNIGWGCLDALGFDIADPAVTQDYNRGLLYYAGTVSTVGISKELPYNEEVLQKVNGTDRKNLALSAYQDIQELSSYIRLLSRYQGVLGSSRGYSRFEAALVGSGVAHIVTRDSIEAGPPPENEEDELTPEERLRGVLAMLEISLQMGDSNEAFETTHTESRKPRNIQTTDEPVNRIELTPVPFLGEKDRRSSKQKNQFK